MLIWSVLMTLVSQFFVLTDHVVFYIFACLCNLLLPIVTSIYSTTGGRHGAGLLRVGYVFCDPVLACITIVPLLLLNRLPGIVDDLVCLASASLVHNDTIACVENTTVLLSYPLARKGSWAEQRAALFYERRVALLVIQICLVFPAMLALSMGRRTRKMNLSTSVLVFSYWLITGIEAGSMIETALLGDRYIHSVYTTETIVSVVMIIANSYAIVTLCSYISPMGCRDHHATKKRFDFLYKTVMGVAGIIFIEIPQLVARCQILAAGSAGPNQFLSGVFYMWMIKDILFIPLIITLLLLQKMGRSPIVDVIKTPCAVNFDNPDVFFLPEKRDAYIVRHKHILTQSSVSDYRVETESLVLSEQGKPVSTTEDCIASTSDASGGPRKTKRVTFKSDYIRQVQPMQTKATIEQDTGV